MFGALDSKWCFWSVECLIQAVWASSWHVLIPLIHQERRDAQGVSFWDFLRLPSVIPHWSYLVNLVSLYVTLTAPGNHWFSPWGTMNSSPTSRLRSDELGVASLSSSSMYPTNGGWEFNQKSFQKHILNWNIVNPCNIECVSRNAFMTNMATVNKLHHHTPQVVSSHNNQTMNIETNQQALVNRLCKAVLCWNDLKCLHCFMG